MFHPIDPHDTVEFVPTVGAADFQCVRWTMVGPDRFRGFRISEPCSSMVEVDWRSHFGWARSSGVRLDSGFDFDLPSERLHWPLDASEWGERVRMRPGRTAATGDDTLAALGSDEMPFCTLLGGPRGVVRLFRSVRCSGDPRFLRESAPTRGAVGRSAGPIAESGRVRARAADRGRRRGSPGYVFVMSFRTTKGRLRVASAMPVPADGGER
jgi:hypothetical protein